MQSKIKIRPAELPGSLGNEVAAVNQISEVSTVTRTAHYTAEKAWMVGCPLFFGEPTT